MRYLIFILLIGIAHVSLAQNANSVIRDGNSQYVKKEYSEAEKSYLHSIEKDPGSFPGNYNLGNSLYRQNKNEDAARQYLQSASNTKDKEEVARAYFNMGNALLKSEKYQESVEAYKLSLKNNPNDDNTRYNLSYALMKLKKQQQKNKQNKDKNEQNKDKQQQKQEQQQQQQQQQRQDQQQQQQQPKISKEDAERMLDALKNEEKDLQKKKAKRYEIRAAKPEKDW